MNCPGHSGHIELCVPVYQPLTFPKLMQLLRIKCLACHSFRLEKRQVKIFQTKFHLIDSGKCPEALELDQYISTVIRRHANPDNANVKVDPSAAASSIDLALESKMNSLPRSFVHTLTSHERAVRKQLVKDFISDCLSCKKCNNCGAFSPRIRQDNSNKIFQSPLSEKYKKANMGENIKIVPAAAMQDTDFDISNGGLSYNSDDSDYDDDDEKEPEGISTMSDDDEGHHDDEDDDVDVAMEGRKKRESTVSKSASSSSKPDKFMHALEVEAQARLLWKFEPFICSKIFGNAHSHAGPMDPHGYNIFFMRAIPVPPSRFRPPMVLGTMTVEHAQNYYLNRVMELNDRLRITFGSVWKSSESVENDSGIENGMDTKKKNDDETEQARAISTWIDLQTTVNCFIDSSKDPSAAATQNVPNGIRQLLEKKEGIFRKHMMGKRVNFACRSVISPDPYIGTNEIGIPLYFAKTLTYPTPVTALNVEEMRKLVIRGPNQYPGAVWVELPNGRRIEMSKMQQTKREAIAARLLSTNGVTIVGRQLRNGDMVLMNRQVRTLVLL